MARKARLAEFGFEACIHHEGLRFFAAQFPCYPAAIQGMCPYGIGKCENKHHECHAVHFQM